jgi:hypothetical protein
MLRLLPSRRAIALLLPLLLVGAGSCDSVRVRIALPTAASNALPVSIGLAGLDPASVSVALDGVDVTPSFAPAPGGLAGVLPVPAPGAHVLRVRRNLNLLGFGVPISNNHPVDVPAPAPAVTSIEPAPGATVARSAWLRVRLAAAVTPDTLVGFGFALECNGDAVSRSAHALADGSLVLNPAPELPAGASCRAVWRADDGSVAESAFQVASDASGLEPATVLYDRLDPLAVAPFPDDYWTVPEPSYATGVAIDMPVPPFSHLFQLQAFTALVGQTLGVDGWSRTSPIAIAFSEALDPAAVPADEFASIDPMAAVSLVDVDPASPDYGERVPFRMVARSDVAPDGSTDHVALLFPSIDLREAGRYVVVVGRRAFASGEPGRPFGASPFFADVLAQPDDADSPEVVRARDRIGAALAALEALEVPIPREDVALAFGLSIRTDWDPTDLTYIKEQYLAAPPPTLILPDLANPCPNADNFCIRTTATRALQIRGRVALPDYRDPGTRLLIRDETTGLPVQTRVVEVPFMMSLPFEALDGPVPFVMYQHGNPGSPREAISDGGTGYLDDAGWAVGGIQDTLNDEISETDVSLQVQFILLLAVSQQQLPDFWIQTGANMIGWLRTIQGLGSLDLMHRGGDGLPALGPDGIPEIDPTRILYHGISEGGNNAQRFLPFAPEIIAATPTVGGARLGETIIHQSSDGILDQIGVFLPELRPVELWIGLSLFQLGFDYQDGHHYLKHLYKEPLLPFAGSSDVTPPSTLWTEGTHDELVPNSASRAAAHEVGMPHVRPVVQSLPMLEQVDAPLAENLGPGLTVGYFQYDWTALPFCIAAGFTNPGHGCAQRLPEAQAQRRHFLETALDGAAEIVSPF